MIKLFKQEPYQLLKSTDKSENHDCQEVEASHLPNAEKYRKNIDTTAFAGRSMVEMLGVLAIIGVLSVGGIAGYSKAMGKYKLNKTQDQISNIIANIRTVFASSSDYSSLASEPVKTAIKLGVFPEDMVTGEDSLKNAYGGDVTLETVEVDGRQHAAFRIVYEQLPRDAVIAIGTSNWGDSDKIGLKEIKINGD